MVERLGLGTVAQLAAQFGNDTGRVEVSFDGEGAAGAADRIGPTLAGLEHVESIEAGEGPGDTWTLVVRPASAGREVREAVLAAAAREDLGLTAIRSTEASLDEIYRAALRQAGLHPSGRENAEPVEASA